MTPRPIIHIIDGSGYVFRAYYAIRPLSTRAGLPTNAVFGFARMLSRLIKDEQPTSLAIAFDTAKKNFRHEIYTEYKANRDAPPEDLVPQFALIRELVAAMDIPVIEKIGYEADDLLATLTDQAVASGHQVMLVSGDKDLMQLVAPHVTMFDPLKNKYYNREDVIERFGVPPELVADLLALAGDPSDNIPGVPKIGSKTAAKLICAYGDIETIYKNLNESSKKLSAAEVSVIDNIESARLSKRLATLDHKAPVQLNIDAWQYQNPASAKLLPFLQRIEASGLIRDLGLEDSNNQIVLPTNTPYAPTVDQDSLSSEYNQTIDYSSYRTIFNLNELEQLMQKAKAHKYLSFDLETTSINAHRADIVGIALAVDSLAPVYIPIAHRYLGVPKQIELSQALAFLKPILCDPQILKVGQNIKYDINVLTRAGIKLQGIGDDSMIAAYVLSSTRVSYSLDALASEKLGHQNIRYTDITGKGKSQIGFEEVAIETATTYAAEDADVALRLCHILRSEIEEQQLNKLYRELELPLVSVLANMEHNGILVDANRLATLGSELNERITLLESHAYTLIGGKINLASPKQLQELLFNKLGLATARKTKTGYSTDQETLEALASEHEIPRIILEHRTLAKLKSTYVDLLTRMINPETGRVHTSFNQTGTATGRLSSSDPNLQNIPIRTDDGRRIRAAFIADPKHVLISADYSQIELRVMAHLSKDTNFINAYKNGEDIHHRTAFEIITGGGPVNAEARRRAKAINFGILYGLSEFGLAKQLGIPRGEAAAYIKLYFSRYPGIRDYFDTTIQTARISGYVSTIAGRRRYLPELHSQNRNIRQGAERIAMNTPIQGSAADLIKMAMLRLYDEINKNAPDIRLLLQVHDELVVEAPEAKCDLAVELVKEAMSLVMPLAVPLTVDVGVGYDWASAH
ncbi:MAG: DNA polymerase I [Deltaproteobacteria bacterium]|nr:DNA polymerase I [Deltaproteobacteria bacterium]